MRVVITGAEGSLGQAVTAAFHDAGADLARLVRLAPRQNEEGIVVTGDLADESRAAEAIGRAADILGGLDAVVHLVGGFHWTRVETSSLADWRRLFSDNVETAVAVAKAASRRLAAGGSLTLVGAQSAQPAADGFGPYGAAKSGVARLAEALAAEWRPRGLRVNAVLPAVIDTPQNRRAMPDADWSAWTSPRAIADVIRFVAGPEARAINGALISASNAA